MLESLRKIWCYAKWYLNPGSKVTCEDGRGNKQITLLDGHMNVIYSDSQNTRADKPRSHEEAAVTIEGNDGLEFRLSMKHTCLNNSINSE